MNTNNTASYTKIKTAEVAVPTIGTASTMTTPSTSRRSIQKRRSSTASSRGDDIIIDTNNSNTSNLQIPPSSSLLASLPSLPAIRRRSSATAAAVLRTITTTAASAVAYNKIDDFRIDDDDPDEYYHNDDNNKDSSNNDDDLRYGINYSIDENDDDNIDDDDNESTTTTTTSCWDYTRVLRKYPAYRVYLLSHMCQQLGDWFVRIAGILIVEELATAYISSTLNGGDDEESATGKALSYMTLARLLPNAVFAQIGGILADRFDRRHLMIGIDILSGIVVLGYLLAIHYKSLTMFYVVTSLRSALNATYYPSTTGIVPLLVHGNRRDLQLAVTMNTWVWGSSAIIGGLLAGPIASLIGLQACYVVDLVTYWISATLLMTCIKGNYKVSNSGNQQQQQQHCLQKHRQQQQHRTSKTFKGYQPAASTSISSTTTNETIMTVDDGVEIEDDNFNGNNNDTNHQNTSSIYNHYNNPFKKAYGEFRELFVYLSTCGFGMMIFLKASGSFVWGIEDVVGAQFSTVFRDDDTEEVDEKLSSIHMGLLFSVIGSGCMVGPALLNLITDARQPYTLQRACWIGLLFLTGGWLAISLVQTFPQFLLFSFIRVMGAGSIWVNSAIVLQTLSEPQILGRILAAEYTLVTLFEASSVFVTGRLSVAGFSKNMLALFGACLGIPLLVMWGIYYSLSLGAADPRFNNNYKFTGNQKITMMSKKEIEMGNVHFDVLEIEQEEQVAAKEEKSIAFV